MNCDVPALIAASLLAARPARGRYAPERELGTSYPRYRVIAATHAEGPRAERRAKASPSVRARTHLTLAEKAFLARSRPRVARQRYEERWQRQTERRTSRLLQAFAREHNFFGFDLPLFSIHQAGR